MRSKNSLLSLVLALSFSHISGQGTDYVYYFDANLAIVDKAHSVMTGHGSLENHLFNLKVVANNLPTFALLDINFTDSSLSVNQGLFRSFYLNGTEELECNYDNNQLDGAWKKWDSTAHLTDSLWYDHGKITDSTAFYYAKNGMLSMSDFTDFKKDQFHELVYNDSGRITTEVSFTGPKGIIHYQNGKTDSLFTREKTEASFKGGPRAWTMYVARTINSNLDKFTAKDFGTCLVKFIVDTDGMVSDVHAITMQGTLLARIAVKAIEKGPNWIPAMQFGHAVKAVRFQPVTLQNMDK